MDSFNFDRVTRDLNTDQGLPLDSSRAVPLSLGEEPVFRGIMMAEAPTAAMRFVEPPTLAARHEVTMHAALPKPTLRAAPRVVQTEIEVPSVDEQLAPLERTRFEVTGNPETLKRELTSLLTTNCVTFSEEDGPYELFCTKSCDESFQKCTFVVRMLKASSQKFVIELQRRGGCPRLFNYLFRIAKAHWHKCAQVNKPLAAPRLVRSSSTTPCAGLEAQSPEQWNCLLNWMDADPCEAIRCIAALASNGAAVPDTVIAKLVTFLASDSEFKVEAMQAITAAVPSNQLNGQECAIFQAVSDLLSSGSSIEEREACKFVAKLSKEMPHVLRRSPCDFADKLAAVSSSQWTCIREFAEQSLAVLQNATEVH